VDPLARRYRTLLLAYPDSYRHQRGEELLGTLMDAARPGQRRPTAAEAADLVLGGLRQRLGGALAADLESGLQVAAPFALALAAGLCGFLWLTVERLPDGVRAVGPFLTVGPAAYALWLAAAGLRAVLPAVASRVPVAAAMAATAMLLPAAAIGGYQRPPLWVILALLGFGAIALAGGGQPLPGAARLAVPVGALVAAALARALMVWQDSGPWWADYYQPALWLAGVLAALAVIVVAVAGAVAAVRGESARPYLWAALLLALPGGWLGPMNTQRALMFQPGLAFGRLAEVVLASCVVVAAMVWLATTRQGLRVGLLDRVGGVAIGCAAGVSTFLGLASAVLFVDRDWPVGDWPVYLGWVLAATAWPLLGSGGRRIAASGALLLTLVVSVVPDEVGPPPGVRGGLAALGVVALIAPGTRRGRLAIPLTTLAMTGAAWLVAVYDNGWQLTGWTAYQQTAALVMTVVIAPLTVAVAAGVRAVADGTRPTAGAIVALIGAGWIGLLALPSLAHWGPILLLLPVGLAAVLIVARLRRGPAAASALRRYADVHGGALLSLAYLLSDDRVAAGDLVEQALAAAYRSGRVDDREVLRYLVGWAVRRPDQTAPSTVGDPLWTAVYRLTPPGRVALVLRLHSGLEPDDIGDLMGLPEPEVRRLTQAALAEVAAATRGTPAK
jgi:DNA-directed RNA polymerase specialized sigma24 family protein